MYNLEYNVKRHDPSITKAQLLPGWGGTTAIVIHTMLYDKSGATSHEMISKDGRNDKELASGEQIKILGIWAMQLSQDQSLSPGLRNAAEKCFDTIQDTLENGWRQ